MSLMLTELKDLFRQADIEGLIAEGAPADEYDAEAEAMANALPLINAAELSIETIHVTLIAVWAKFFDLDPEAVSLRGAELRLLSQRIFEIFRL